jgi:hypothetical protein
MADYEIYSEEMFQYVNERYGCDMAVKRYYRKGAYMYSTQLDTKFKLIPVLVMRSDELRSGSYLGQKSFV